MKTVAAISSGLVFSALLAISSAASAASMITVNASDDIFAAGLPSAPGSTSGGGTVPQSIAVTAGEKLLITATGSVNCCDTANNPGLSGPDGFSSNPFGGTGSTITNSTGSSVGTYMDSTGAFSLAGVFLGGPTSTPFKIGSSDTVLVPVGATELYFGLPDAAGFNGASGYYSDNSGSFSVSISAVPEPSVWFMMLGGLALMGAALRFERKRSVALVA